MSMELGQDNDPRMMVHERNTTVDRHPRKSDRKNNFMGVGKLRINYFAVPCQVVNC
jgi:hypothetical protein